MGGWGAGLCIVGCQQPDYDLCLGRVIGMHGVFESQALELAVIRIRKELVRMIVCVRENCKHYRGSSLAPLVTCVQLCGRMARRLNGKTNETRIMGCKLLVASNEPAPMNHDTFD